MTVGEWLSERQRLEYNERNRTYNSNNRGGCNTDVVHMNKAELVGRLLMLLVGFAVAMLGLIYAIHTQDVYLGILISVGGVASMIGGLPQ